MQVTATVGLLPTASPQQALEEMHRSGLTTVPVVDDGHELVGVITEKDALHLMSHAVADDMGSHPRLEVSAGMTPPAPALGMHDGLSHALLLLGMVSWDALPVTDGRRVVGMLSRREAMAVRAANERLISSATRER